MKVLFTGGGSAGHVTPNVALIEAMIKAGWQVFYVGSRQGIEREIISRLEIPYHGIATGKLRRYFSASNFVDPFRIVWGVLEALVLCLSEHPDVVFSKGGFVSVPVVFSAWLCRIPVISHESDVSPGLATRLCVPFSRWVCVNFQQTSAYLPGNKIRITGTPVRASLRQGNAERGRSFLDLDPGKPVLMVFGGSLGAQRINAEIRRSLDLLLDNWQVVHICGAGNLGGEGRSGYRQYEYIHDEFGDVLAAADVVIARAGANSIYELLVTAKPHILIPLSLAASRGDQIVNARVCEEAGYSRTIMEEDLSPESLVALVDEIYGQRHEIIRRLNEFDGKDSVKVISELIMATAGN